MTILRLGDDYLLRLVDLGVVFFSVAVVVCKLHPYRQVPLDVRTGTIEREGGQVIEWHHLPVVNDELQETCPSVPRYGLDHLM